MHAVSKEHKGNYWRILEKENLDLEQFTRVSRYNKNSLLKTIFVGQGHWLLLKGCFCNLRMVS